MSSQISRTLTLAERTAGLVKHVDVDQVLRRVNSSISVGHSVDLGWGRVYGGQTMAQALSAAQNLAGESRNLHQLSCHFLRPGDVKHDIEFEADLLADGKSFAVAHVRALQKGKSILTLTASLQTPEEGLDHQYQHRFSRDGKNLRPEWKKPQELESIFEHMQPYVKDIPAPLRPLYEHPQPIEVRPSEFIPPWEKASRPPVRANWVKSRLALPSDPRVHQRLLTYISDWGLLETSVFPHEGVGMWMPNMQMASLSHSMVFHRDFKLDEQWLCHAMYSPTSSGGRGYSLGEFWTEDGDLIASTSQEGLIRVN
ncbi:hypothetical protein TrRE_jg4478 [Triparma retinervis]|uniref:Acyl-CoA thioesterase II n=1 Tax=Triparma retinervis TaxID=2557542 RepID=A0A9W6ZH84_9STRA|nr:hypothetical protein TrRE_jg4478 [Triparma retinervis]